MPRRDEGVTAQHASCRCDRCDEEETKEDGNAQGCDCQVHRVGSQLPRHPPAWRQCRGPDAYGQQVRNHQAKDQQQDGRELIDDPRRQIHTHAAQRHNSDGHDQYTNAPHKKDKASKCGRNRNW